MKRSSSARPHPVTGVALVALGPGIWFAHLSISYFLVPYSCRIGSDLPIHAVTLVALIGAVVTTVIAVRAVRGGGRDRFWRWFFVSGEAVKAERDDRQTLFVLSAAMAAYFWLVVAVTGLVPVVVNRCA
jgi:hypothetical protein